MKTSEIQKPNPNFVIYETEGNEAKVSVRLDEETVWLTQKQLAEIIDHFAWLSHQFQSSHKISSVGYGTSQRVYYRQREMKQLESDFDKAVKQLTKNK